jgi:hypothetical protein
MNVAAVSALIFAGLIDRSTVTSEEALRLTNVTIQLVRGSRNLGIEARISNPNGFAVFNVRASCDFRDRQGQIISSSVLTITDAVQANTTRRIQALDAGEWPVQARTADCVLLEAKRLPD